MFLLATTAGAQLVNPPRKALQRRRRSHGLQVDLLRVTEQVIDVDTVARIHDGGYVREVSGADCIETKNGPDQNASTQKRQTGNPVMEHSQRITWKEKGSSKVADATVEPVTCGWSTRSNEALLDKDRRQ